MLNRLSERKNSLVRLLLFITVFIISYLVFNFVLLISYVPTNSMEPTVKAETLCIGTRIKPNGYKNSDIIVFHKDGELLLKRIVASGGETYEYDGKEYEIPEGQFFVRGDNAEHSFDSRYWDEPYISEDDIEASLIFYISCKN